MKTIRNLLVIIFILLIASSTWAAGTVTATANKIVNPYSARPEYLRILLTCTADAGLNTYPATIINEMTNIINVYNLVGLELYLVGAYPGSPAPTDATDSTIMQDGIDLLGGKGTDLIDNTGHTQTLVGPSGSYAPQPVTGKLTLNISNNAVGSAVTYLILMFRYPN